MPTPFKLNDPRSKFKKDRLYRLDMIYGLKANGSKDSRYPNQTLIVQFSELSDSHQSVESIQDIKPKDLFKDGICHWDGTKKLCRVNFEVDLTNQVLMKAGTIWKNSSCIWEPNEFLNVSISQENKEINSYSLFKKQGLPLPFMPLPVLGTSLVRFPKCKIYGEEKVTILIPTLELIRYYFSGSKFFNMQLFNNGLEYIGGVQSPTIYRFDPKEGTDDCYIWLRRRCYDSDAILLARGIKDFSAMQAMRYVSASINYQKSSGRDIVYPRANLPFSDATDLEVSGQWLAPDENGKFTAYLVRSINRCYHDLPFKNLLIESIDSYKSGSFKKVEISETKKDDGGDSEPDNQCVDLTQGQPPSNEFDEKEFEFALDRTPDLLNVNVEKVSKASEKETQKLIEIEEAEDAETEADSTLPGNSRKDNPIQPWDMKLTPTSSISIDRRLSIVANVVYELEQNDLLTANIPLSDRSTDGSAPYGLYIFQKPTNKDRGYHWHQIEDRKRRALILKLTDSQHNEFYVLEIESKDKETFALYLLLGINKDVSVSLCNNNKANNLLQEIADTSGKRFISSVLKKHFRKVKSIRHESVQGESFEDRLSRILLNQFDD